MKAKFYIFASRKPTKRKETKKQKETALELVHFIRHIKAFLLILRGLKSGQFQTTHLSKAVNAHDCYRGLYLLDVLGSPEPQTSIRIKSHVFYARTSRKNQKKYNRLWDLGGDKKQKDENSTIRQATMPIDNNGGNMYAIA